ncbi:hypothetical protein ACXAT3_003872 [Clostridium sporogenes]
MNLSLTNNKNRRAGRHIMELLMLIVRIILMILEGVAADIEVTKVSKESGIGLEKLWSALPSKYK